MVAPAADESEVLAAVSAVLQGDTQAFGSIVTRYQRLVYRLALSFLGSTEEAEDATQEIFLKVYAALARFQLDRRFHPWLYTIAINHLRSRQRMVVSLRAHRAAGTDPDSLAASGAQESGAAETRDRVRIAVRALPPNLRAAAVLYYLEGLDTAEAAEVLGIGVENLKSRLHRARARLRGSLAEEV